MVPTTERMRSRYPHPTPNTLKKYPTHLVWLFCKVNSEPEDGQHIGPKHVYTLYYYAKYRCVRLYV